MTTCLCVGKDSYDGVMVHPLDLIKILSFQKSFGPGFEEKMCVLFMHGPAIQA